MRIKPFLLNSLIVFALSFLGYGAGKLAGSFLLGESDPSWTYFSIPTPPERIIDIVNFHLSSSSNGPDGDTVYVKAENSEFYTFTLFQSNWLLMDVDPTAWEYFYVSECATEWAGPSAFYQLKAYPPIEKGVVDSVGANFELPPISFARCFVLLDDGGLQAWSYSGNAKDLLRNRFLKKGFMIIGVSIGVALSVFFVHKKTKQTKNAER